jgi:hypothetical protein
MPRFHATSRLVRFLALLGVFVALAFAMSVQTASAAGGSINGTIFDDLNNDGALSGESGHGAVVVFIDVNGNNALDGPDVQTTTDGSGSYSFPNVADGTYSVKAVVPVGYGATTLNPVTTIVSGSANVLNVNIGISNVGSVSGYVFNDVDGDGNQDMTDNGLSARTVFIDSNLNGSFSAGEPTVVTDGSGFYSFTGLTAGTNVTVRATVPGTALRTSPNPNPIAVTAGLVQDHVDFALFTYGSITGTVFNDVNADGIKAAGDTGINARTVYCDLDGDLVKDAGEPSAASNAAGLYTINGLGPITCAPRLVVPANTVQTTANPATFTVISGQSVTGAEFGSFQFGSITGVVFSDGNANGTKEVAEAGLSGKTVYLDADNDGTLDVGETNLNSNGTGTYTFANLGPGTYNVRAVLLPNSTQTSAALMTVSMTSGQSAAGTNFGFFLNASITGSVYEDTNGSSTLTAGELGIAAQVVFIDANANDSYDFGEVNTTTNASGVYTLSGLTPGSYRVRAVLPAGWMRTTTNPTPVTPTSGSSTTNSFGLFELATINGVAYDDYNGDGLKQAGETGFDAVTVFLDTDNDNGFDVGEPSAVTAANGTFSISGLGPGSYKPRNVMPVGTTLTTTLPVAITTTSGMVSNITQFGLFKHVIISGSAYNDFDGDGVRELGEAGLAGKLIFLDSNSSGLLNAGEPTTTTDSSGNYSFTGLGPGTYKPRVNLTAGTERTSANPADIVAYSGATVTGQDFGLFSTASITGTVFNDMNSSGTKDAGDAGLTPRTVYLDTNSNGALDTGETSVATGNGGVYTISNLGPGTYRVRVVVPANVVLSSTLPAAITPSGGSVSISNDFGLFTLGSIGGTIFDDKNGNGAKAGAEPVLAGRTVYLDSDASGTYDTGEPTALSSPTGVYSFTGLVAGSYRVRLQALSGVLQTTPDPSVITVQSGTSLNTVDFGTFNVAIISGTVYDDQGGNGTLNVPQDVGIAGITVFMDNNNNGTQDLGEISVVSDSVGLYTFANLGPGNYIPRAVFPSATMYQTTTMLSAVTPNSGQTSAGNNMGLFTYGTVSGMVWVDENGNGVKDGPELGVANARVYHDNNSGNTYTNGEPTVMTAADGSYTLGGLKNGTVKARVVMAGGQVLSTTLIDSSPIASKTVISGRDFGLFAQATITGTIFEDKNANKVRDNGEILLSARSVYIDANNNGRKEASEKMATTTGPGSFTLSNLGPGPWQVLLVIPTGQVQTTVDPDSILLASGGTAAVSFGMRDTKLGPVSPTTPVPTAPGDGTDEGDADGPPVPKDAMSVNTGYWMASAEGGVFAYGNAPFFGSAVPFKPNKPIVGLAATPENKGYHLVATDGGIFSFGDAKFEGSMGGKPLNKPMVGMAVTPSGKGYWTVATDGGIFAYGDAKFYGSTGSMTLNRPIVGMQATTTGQGYWLVASDGGIFAFGDAKFYGSTGSIALNKPIVGMARSAGDTGYWLVASDGGVFAFGDAKFLGSTGGQPITAPIVTMHATYAGDGYMMVGADGGVYVFGKSTKFGEKPPTKSPIVN